MAKYLGPLKILLFLRLTENIMWKQAHPWMYIYIYLSSLGWNLTFLIMLGCTHTDRQVFSLSPSPCGGDGTGGDEHGQPLGDRASTIDMGLALGLIFPRPATGLNILEGSRMSKKECAAIQVSFSMSTRQLCNSAWLQLSRNASNACYMSSHKKFQPKYLFYQGFK